MILCWNVRGLNKLGKLKAIKDFINSYKCNVICLREHKLKKDTQQILHHYWGGMASTDNLSSDPAGKVLVIWNPLTVALTKTSQSSQFIHFDASFKSLNFALSVVYGANEIGLRRLLWDDLSALQPHHPWIVMGDFNCTRNVSEKLGSSVQNATAMSDMNDFIDVNTLQEMPTTGSTFTWCNMNQSRPIL